MNIFLFHNDLRLYDNTALAEAIKTGKTIPVFIFTPEQITSANKYRSQNSINFMCESLKNLDDELRTHNSKLHTYYGNTNSVISKIIKQIKPRALYCNANYTPYAKKRDKDLAKLCKTKNVEFCQYEDYGLLPVVKPDHTGLYITESHTVSRPSDVTHVYLKFTPYYDKVKKHKIRHPQLYKLHNLGKISGGAFSILKYYKSPTQIVQKELKAGGRKNGLVVLAHKPTNYDKTRNILTKNTTQLSAYIKFGCLSIREVYYSVPNKNSDLIKQLFWREFFMNIVNAYPHILNGQHGHRNFKDKYDKVNWNRTSNNSYFVKWCNGQTGYPIVDAAMRQLNEIGWMHNRGRLIVSGFLVKIMGWHWELGERYFAIKLRDYDPAQNNGGWQFVAGSGVDSQPYFRIFNPWLQSAKYDPNAEYIKKWCPELKDVPARDIHFWYKTYEEHDNNYPEPMIEYEKWRDKTRKLYRW